MIAITRLKKSTKFQSNAESFDGDLTSSYFDAISDNLRRHNSVKRDDVILKLCQFTSLHRAHLLVKFHDDRRSRTCRTKSPPFKKDLVLEIALFVDYDVTIQQHKVGYTVHLAEW